MSTTRQDLVKAYVDDAYGWAMEAYDEEATIFDQLFDVENSEGAYEQYTTAIGPNRLTETAEAAQIDRTTATEGFTVYCANKKFAIELPISNEAIDDNRKIENFLRAWAKDLGEAARTTKEEVHANLFNKGGFTAGHSVFNNDIAGGVLTTYTDPKLCYDGKPFLNITGNARTAKHGGTYFNGQLVLTLDSTALQTATKRVYVTNAYNEAGRKISIVPNIILVQLHSDNWWTAKRIVESSGDTSATHSGVANLYKNFRVIGWPYLTDSDAWFVGKALKGLKSLARMPLAIDYYEEKRVDSQVVRARVRFGCAVTNFRYWFGANFSQS